MSQEKDKNQEHLRLLSIFHYILAGISAVFSCIPIIHLVIGIVAINCPECFKDEAGQIPPPFFGWIFTIIGAVMIFLGWAFAFCLFLAGRYLVRRKHYLFCFVTACISCLFIPFGTALGVFTIIVLSRSQVAKLFN